MSWMTRCVMNVTVFSVMGSTHHSIVDLSAASNTTVSTAGPLYMLCQASTTIVLLPKTLGTDLEQCLFVDTTIDLSFPKNQTSRSSAINKNV